MKSVDVKSLIIGILGTALVMVLMGQSFIPEKPTIRKIECMNSWSSPQKVVHQLVWEINPIGNMKGGLKWPRNDTNPKKS